MEFACLAFRTYLLLCICNGVQIPSGIFFQAIGKSTKSAILSLSRQIVILIPAMRGLFMVTGLTGTQLMWIVGLAFAPTLVIQMIRVIREAR